MGLRLLSSMMLRQTKYTTGDSCDGGISVLNQLKPLPVMVYVRQHSYTTRDSGLTNTYRVDEALEDYGRRLLEYTLCDVLTAR